MLTSFVNEMLQRRKQFTALAGVITMLMEGQQAADERLQTKTFLLGFVHSRNGTFHAETKTCLTQVAQQRRDFLKEFQPLILLGRRVMQRITRPCWVFRLYIAQIGHWSAYTLGALI